MFLYLSNNIPNIFQSILLWNGLQLFFPAFSGVYFRTFKKFLAPFWRQFSRHRFNSFCQVFRVLGGQLPSCRLLFNFSKKCSKGRNCHQLSCINLVKEYWMPLYSNRSNTNWTSREVSKSTQSKLWNYNFQFQWIMSLKIFGYTLFLRFYSTYRWGCWNPFYYTLIGNSFSLDCMV